MKKKLLVSINNDEVIKNKLNTSYTLDKTWNTIKNKYNNILTGQKRKWIIIVILIFFDFYIGNILRSIRKLRNKIKLVNTI